MLTDVYFAKSMPMQGLIVAGTPPRLLKALEIMNKNQHVRYKEALIGEPTDCVDREVRLATVWMTFIMDAVITLNSYWNGNIYLDEVQCPFPIGDSAFQGTVNYIEALTAYVWEYVYDVVRQLLDNEEGGCLSKSDGSVVTNAEPPEPGDYCFVPLSECSSQLPMPALEMTT
jgi:hypothetical protein